MDRKAKALDFDTSTNSKEIITTLAQKLELREKSGFAMYERVDPTTGEPSPSRCHHLSLLPLYHFILILLFRTMDLSHRTVGWLDVQVGSTRMVFGDRWRQTHIQKKNLHQRTQCKHSSLSPASPPSRFHVSSLLIFLYVGAFGPSVQGLAVLPGSRRRAQRSIPGHWSWGDAFGFSWDAGRLRLLFIFSFLSPLPLHWLISY